jgi:hypothetical protein
MDRARKAGEAKMDQRFKRYVCCLILSDGNVPKALPVDACDLKSAVRLAKGLLSARDEGEFALLFDGDEQVATLC